MEYQKTKKSKIERKIYYKFLLINKRFLGCWKKKNI